MAGQKYDKDVCIALLREKQALLAAQGCERYPRRSDFDLNQVVAIKAFLGPWPRALEEAGIKPPRSGDAEQRAFEKHPRQTKPEQGLKGPKK